MFWQAVFYLVAVYFCWPILLGSFTIKHFDEKHYPFYVVFFICAPLQGFLNALVYFRPRVVKTIRDRRRQRASNIPNTSLTDPSREIPEELPTELPPNKVQEARMVGAEEKPLPEVENQEN